MSNAFVLNRPCLVCGETAVLLDVVDFNKSCEEQRGKFLPLSGVPIYYSLCRRCGFLFASEFAEWTLDDFRSKIYNTGYIDVDPDYPDARPRVNARNVLKMFSDHGARIRHLDFGGGSGTLSKLLVENGWCSVSYDPFVDDSAWEAANIGRYDLITAFEVFEHVPEPRKLATTLAQLLTSDGVVLFSTLTSDGHVAPNRRLTWWYASPRNGHISLFSKKSLAILAEKESFRFGSFSPGFHAFWKTVPPWAEHIIRVR